ncbi:MAG TPA: prolyl oligopeptidase family serine peptidase [Terracidiphilus sp.]|jgi:dipeptidyl aminopeptidase/acylaminoacyl peptidase|nr:prolyl oligopeptidase family serine peptidase [Terracidiphilus sp.]
MHKLRCCVLLIGLFPHCWVGFYAQTKTPGISTRDCVQVRYIVGVWMSPQGTRVAYLVKSPNLAQNRNDYQIYVRDILDRKTGPGQLVFAGADISGIRWLGDGEHLSMLIPEHGSRTLMTVSAEDGSHETLLALSRDVDEYSIDRAGTTIAYSITNAEVGRRSRAPESDENTASGYRVRYGEKAADSFPTSSVYIVRRQADGNWAPPDQVTIEDPFTHERFSHIRAPSYLSLSPDGRLLALNYWTDASLPDEWKQNPYVRSALGTQALQRIMVIQDIEGGRTSLGFRNLYPDSEPLWSRDSQSFLMNAHSPVGSAWAQEDIRDHRTSGLDANLFWVEVDSGKVQEVFRHVPDHHQGPLFWTKDGDVVVSLLGDAVARFHQEGDSWQEVQKIRIPGSDEDRFWFLVSNGFVMEGVHQTVTTPEDLFAYDPSEGKIRILTDLNPELGHLGFAGVKTIHWATPEGLALSGLLFMPPDYDPKRRYPLVIQTKGDQGWFTCDSGFNHDPAFAPQPIASAGILYLVRTSAAGFSEQDELDKVPKGYPGQIGLAVQQMNVWDSAVKTLSERGLIDVKKVGVIGFSATGFYVDFLLTQSRIPYAAATTADNADYSLSDYWQLPAFSDAEDSMYGGPPYGSTLENWRRYSISFNLEKIHTPLLMEEMGYGVHDDMRGVVPLNLVGRYEIYKGLTRLGKPVEMYYYPDEDHAPDHPQARLASLQRNVDWYRFWLQRYEDPDQAKKEQYIRWRRLRELQRADSPASRNGADSMSNKTR